MSYNAYEEILEIVVSYTHFNHFVLLNADVYERIVKPGKKAGFFQLLATQTVSAVWHVSAPSFLPFLCRDSQGIII